MKIVNSYNEWDLLEEIIVGCLDGAMLPTWQTIARATVPPDSEYLKQRIAEREVAGASPYSLEQIEAGKKDLAEFIHILEAEGVKVRQPKPYPFSQSYSTPYWKVNSGFCCVNPRDVFMVIGNEIIEAPMAHRDRHYEMHPYRSIIKDYFAQGARWTSAPKPQLLDDLIRRKLSIPWGRRRNALCDDGI